MKFIITILNRIIQKDLPKPVGRWNIDYCNKKINNKVDWSNEDHCGPCGQYELPKMEVEKDVNKNSRIEKPKS